MTSLANKITPTTWRKLYSSYRKAQKAKERLYLEVAGAKPAFELAYSEWLDAIDLARKDVGGDADHRLGLIPDKICDYAHTKPIDLSEFSPAVILRARLRDKLPETEIDPDDFFGFIRRDAEKIQRYKEFYTPEVESCYCKIKDGEARAEHLLIKGLSLSQIVWLHETKNISYSLFGQARNEPPKRKLP